MRIKQINTVETTFNMVNEEFYEVIKIATVNL